jgi:hypothetical protein
VLPAPKKRILTTVIASSIALACNAFAASQQQGQQQAGKQASQRSQSQQRAYSQQSQQKTSKKNQRVAPRLSAREASQQGLDDVAPNTEVRQFHEVLNDLLSEFAYDVKQGQINGLKNLSIRRIDISDTLPRTYEQYTELLVSERIRENSKVKLINCIPCKSKSSTMVEGKLIITSPLTNVQKMDEAANQLGIENYMDVVLVYHTTHMVLAFNVFSTQTKELVWARTYNSETVRSRYQRMAVDFNQIEKSRNSDEYVPDYKILVGFSGSNLPNVAGGERDKSFLGVHIRSVEKFANRKLDFGLLTSGYISTAKFLNTYPSEGAATSSSSSTTYSGSARPLPYTYVLGVQALTAYNFVGDVEVYDRVRHGVHFGLGGIISTGYLAPSARLGWDTYFGRRFVLTVSAQYISESTILVKGDYQTSRGGGGGDLVLSYNF